MQEKVKIHKETKRVHATRKIALSFLIVIIIGSLLLSTRIANNGVPLPYLDNLFVATSATCVTGLVPTVTVEQYSLFGQLVILVLIQIGGLGFLTLLCLFLIKVQKKLSLSSKIVIQEALNQPSMQDISIMVKRIIRFTIVVELIGMVLLSFVFVPEFGFIKGLYYGLFHSISAFCNAGFDLIGSSSLVPYYDNVIINFTIPALIIAGGFGFIAWFDLKDTYHKEKKRMTFEWKHYIKSLRLHTKIVIVMTVGLILLGMILFLICEFNNPNTIKDMSIFDKIQTAYFQSVTLRTAGFATVDMYSLSISSKLFMCLFMFIGGSPAGTAGGIKTVTFAVVGLMIYNTYHGQKDVHVFQRRLKKRMIIHSFTIISIAIMIVFTGLFILSATEKLPFIDVVFETFSAFATVGLSASVTPQLSKIGKMVVIVLMYIGRIGPITMLLSFAKKSQMLDNRFEIKYLDEDVLLG